MKTIKYIFIMFFSFFLFSCEKSEKDVKNFSKIIINDLINLDSLSLYNKQMNGEITARFGFYDNLTYSDNPQTPQEYIQLSKDNYDKKKEQQLRWYGSMTHQFKNSFDSDIKSYEIESIKLIEEQEVQDMLSTYLKKKKKFKVFDVSLIIKTESDKEYIFKPGMIIILDNKLYYETKGYELKEQPNS